MKGKARWQLSPKRAFHSLDSEHFALTTSQPQNQVPIGCKRPALKSLLAFWFHFVRQLAAEEGSARWLEITEWIARIVVVVSVGVPVVEKELYRIDRNREAETFPE